MAENEAESPGPQRAAILAAGGLAKYDIRRIVFDQATMPRLTARADSRAVCSVNQLTDHRGTHGAAQFARWPCSGDYGVALMEAAN